MNYENYAGVPAAKNVGETLDFCPNPMTEPVAWQTSLAWCWKGCKIAEPQDWVVPSHGGPALTAVAGQCGDVNSDAPS